MLRPCAAPTAVLLALGPAVGLALGLALAGCGGPIDPDRPPLRDYEPPPIGGVPSAPTPPKRL